MNEPVSSPSLLTLTAPSKETSAKSPRTATEDFREQLSSQSKADETRTAATKEKSTKLEKSSDPTTNEKQVRPETEQEATSPGEAVPSADQESVATAPKDEVIELPEGEEVLETLVEGLVVAAPIIVSSTTEELVVSEELLPGEATKEIVAVTNETPEETTKPVTELLDADSDLEPTVSNAVEGNASEAHISETIAASSEIVAKKSSEQELTVPPPAVSEEASPTVSAASVSTTNNQNNDGKQEEKTPAEPSLLREINDAAIRGDGKEQDEADAPAQKSTKTSTPLPAAAAAATAAEKTLPADDNRLDASDSTGRSATVSGAEERTSQRAELTAAAKTRTNSAPTVDPSRFVSRVAKAFEAAQQQGGGPIRMRLSPPELGILQVQIEVKEGILTASLEAETHAARNLLLENLPALRDRLAEQQISVEKFDVDVRDESSGPEYEQADSRGSDNDAQGDGQNRQDAINKNSDSHNQPTTENLTKPSTISFDDDRVDLVA